MLVRRKCLGDAISWLTMERVNSSHSLEVMVVSVLHCVSLVVVLLN